jgi:5-formyltetrahydrofolate cyclo-ligase
MENDKKALREKFIKSRLEIPKDIAKSAAEIITQHLLEIIPKTAKVALYCAMRGEVDMAGLLAALQERGNITSLPVIDDGGKILRFLEVSQDSKLTNGKYGISCPHLHTSEIIPDVVIVPLLAFDKNGNRLGYGGGYYDATLKHLRSRNEKLLVIGAAYAMQKVENLPIHSGDQKMDMMVTEEGITR